MHKILITGATGNVGFEVIRFLYNKDTSHGIVAGVRNIDKAKEVFRAYPRLGYNHFDFENPETFNDALNGVDRIFLLRPPHISDVDKYFKPLIAALRQNKVNEIVFLSVQGADKSIVIPHNKIERLIKNSGLEYIFLRPSYFMQNLTTTLLGDITKKRAIILPAGKATFNWVDIENIGEVGAILLHSFHQYKNQAFEITGLENQSFEKVSQLINSNSKNPIKFRNVNPLKYYGIKKREGMVKGMIMVMILLHYLQRFQKEPQASDAYERLTGKKPTDLKTFIEQNKAIFENSKQSSK